MTDQDKFHWAKKVSRRDIQRLYDSDAQGLLDEDLLDNVMVTIYVRIRDMFEVREAQKLGRVKCRSCGAYISQPFIMGGKFKEVGLVCDQCGWETTCGDFYNSYTGKDMLPGSRTELFQEFLERYPSACTPREKMLLLDWLIHEFHVQSGVSWRLVVMNLIQGSRDQLIELLTSLAGCENQPSTKKAWMVEENDPIRRFRKKYPSHAKVLRVAAQLGIWGRSKMPENELIGEILRRKPELAQRIQD